MDYDVEYGKPPKATRFRKGHSGNPRARKKPGENFITAFKRFANETVDVSLNGVTTRMSRVEAVILRNIMAAQKHDQIAMANILKLMEAAGEFVDLTDPAVVGGWVAFPEKFESTEELLAFHGAETVEMPSIHQTKGP